MIKLLQGLFIKKIARIFMWAFDMSNLSLKFYMYTEKPPKNMFSTFKIGRINFFQE